MGASVLESGPRAGLTDTDWRSIGATTTLPPRATLTDPARARRVMRFPFSRGEFVVESPGELPAWVAPTVDALGSLLELDAEWDSYGGHAVDPNCVRAALKLAFDVLQDDSPSPSVVPTSQGGVQLEWHTSGVDLEIEVVSPTRLYGYFEDQRARATWEKDLTFDRGPLVEAIASLSRQP